MLNYTYEYKLEPNPDQVTLIEKTLETCRSVWNFALRERKDWINSRKCNINSCYIKQEYIIPADAPYPEYNTQAKRLTQARRSNSNLADIHSQVLQQALRTLDTAFTSMKARGMGFPRFKKKGRMRSFVFPQLGKNPVRNDAIKLPQFGWIKWRLHRPIPEEMEIKQARVVKKASGYFVMLSLQLDVNIADTPAHGHPLGIDLGLDKFLATSDGELINRPRFFKTLQRQLKLLQRRLKNMKKGSKNWLKLNKKIARIHQRISDTRKDWQFKLAHHLCDRAGMIFFEDINFISWAKGVFSKHTLDAGFGQFITLLKWVCWKRGVYFAQVDKNYTSQTCPYCGAYTGKKLLKEREHNCPECGYKTHRDTAAAQVIRDKGLSALGHSVEVKEIAFGGDLTGVSSNANLVKSQRERNSNEQSLEARAY